MRIAVLGWGSLIWCPGQLRLGTRWRGDGPELPIEFSRISSDGRLTLVIHNGQKAQKSLWAISEFENLEEARENLRARERCKLKHIHSVRADRRGYRGVKAKVWHWLKGRKEQIEAVVWTGLPSNWRRERRRNFTASDAVAYLRELKRSAQQAEDVLARAREYIRNAPSQIQTEVRKRMSTNANWKDNKLSKTLFEDPPAR